MKLMVEKLKKIIKEELTKKSFTYAADRIANALHGAGASGDEYEIQQYIAQILNRPDNPPRMPGKFSNKVDGHEAVANAVRELFSQAPGKPDRNQIADLANEIAQGIRSRLSESEHSGRAKSALGLEETKMKFTQEQVLSIIKEEIAAVLSEDIEDEILSDIRLALSTAPMTFGELVDEVTSARDDEEVQENLYYLLDNEEVNANPPMDAEAMSRMDNEVWEESDPEWNNIEFSM